MQNAKCRVRNGRPERKADDGGRKAEGRRSQVKCQKARAKRQNRRPERTADDRVRKSAEVAERSQVFAEVWQGRSYRAGSKKGGSNSG